MEEIHADGLSSPATNFPSKNIASSVALSSIFDYRRIRQKSKSEINVPNDKMTSVDSGIETGNDSNDSAIAQLDNYQSRTTRQFSCGPSILADRRSSRTANEHPWKMLQLEEIDEPLSSMSSDVAEAACGPSQMQSGSADSVTGTCGPLVQLPDLSTNEPKRLLRFLMPIKSYTWSPYLREDSDSGKPERSSRHNRYSGHNRSAAYNRIRFLEYAATPRYLNERRLRVAAASNDVDQVERLLKAGVNPNCCDEQLRSPLHLSSGRGYADVVRLLLKHGANPSMQDCIGNTPLHLAAVTSKITVVILLLMAGTDPLCSDIHGYNPLQLAETKLRLLQNCKGGDMLRIKSEVHEVVDLLVSYLKKRDGFGKEVDSLSSFCSRLTLSNTSNQVQDEVRDLLSNIDSLSLKS